MMDHPSTYPRESITGATVSLIEDDHGRLWEEWDYHQGTIIYQKECDCYGGFLFDPVEFCPECHGDGWIYGIPERSFKSRLMYRTNGVEKAIGILLILCTAFLLWKVGQFYWTYWEN